MRRQNTLTLSSEIVEESDFSDFSDFSDTVYNSACVSDVQSLIAKIILCTCFRQKLFDTR